MGPAQVALNSPNDPLFYFGGETEVQLGDRVETRFWLLFYRFRKRGRVVYIPGLSPFNRGFERDGLKWVGIKPDDDIVVIGELVNPKTGHLLKRVRFIDRDHSVLPDAKMPDGSL
jgi:hypothetical protein